MVLDNLGAKAAGDYDIALCAIYTLGPFEFLVLVEGALDDLVDDPLER